MRRQKQMIKKLGAFLLMTASTWALAVNENDDEGENQQDSTMSAQASEDDFYTFWGGQSVPDEVDQSASEEETQSVSKEERISLADRIETLLAADYINWIRAKENGEYYKRSLTVSASLFPEELQWKLSIRGRMLLGKFYDRCNTQEDIIPFYFDNGIDDIQNLNQLLDSLPSRSSEQFEFQNFSKKELKNIAFLKKINIIYLEVGDGVVLHSNYFNRSVIALHNGDVSEKVSGNFSDAAVRDELESGDRVCSIFNNYDKIRNTLIIMDHKALGRLFLGIVSEKDPSSMLTFLEGNEVSLTKNMNRIYKAKYYPKMAAIYGAATAINYSGYLATAAATLLLQKWINPNIYNSYANNFFANNGYFDFRNSANNTLNFPNGTAVGL